MKNDDVRIEQDLCCQYVVKVWVKSWVFVSRHKYIVNAEEIQKAIQNGADRDCVKELISKQDERCNKYIAKYFENWL